MSKLKQGWAWPPISRKAHYFPEGEATSLCNGVAFTGGTREDDNHHSGDNCKQCMRRREKLAGAPTAPKSS
ncbi:MAG TPA: hypothetical protein VF614_15680 [Chthoniobacteraceae bacterium]|jgi:hypothetical protein